MTEENKKPEKKEKVEKKNSTKTEKNVLQKTDEKTETKQESKLEEKPEAKDKSKEKKTEKKEIKHPKKEFAIAKGTSLPVSKRHCMYICNFIKGKNIDRAIEELNEVIKMKKAIPFKGEIPHRKGKGMMSGRYPVKASKYFIYLLKGLKGNSITNGMEIEKTKIVSGISNWASRPMRSKGRSAKRTNVVLTAKEVKS